MDVENNGSSPAPVPNPRTVSRFVSMKHKFETAKLRDLLREKCRIRVKENREKKFDISRNFLHSEKAWITDLLREELEENLLLEDIVYQELIEESYQWLVDQYEKELAYYATKDPNELIAICPICQVNEMKMANQMLSCACGVVFGYQHSLANFCSQMQHIVTLHESKCTSRLLFFLEPSAIGQVKLNAVCDKCDYYHEIVN